MRKIVAVSGGEYTDSSFPTTGYFNFDAEIVRLSGKKHPKLLFIPTASRDSREYVSAVEGYFGKRLGCTVDVLYTVGVSPSQKALQSKIFSTDIVYVGGGNTLYTIRRWKQLGIDLMLKKAWEKGIVMSGISAGSICWFKDSTSDSRMITDPSYKKYIRVKAMNWFPLTMSPHHYFEKKRKPALIQQIQKYGGVGLALDDYAALEIIDDQYRIITAKPFAKAYKVYKDSLIHNEPLRTNVFRPLKELLL